MIGRAPITRSASPARIGAVSFGMSAAWYWLSASVLTMTSAPARSAASMPAANARAKPGSTPDGRCDRPRPAWATATVASVLPSSMTSHSTRSKPGTARGRLASVMPSVVASLKQGIWMIRVRAGASPAQRRAPEVRRRGLCSSLRDDLEQPWPRLPDRPRVAAVGARRQRRHRPGAGTRSAVSRRARRTATFGGARAQQDPVDAEARRARPAPAPPRWRSGSDRSRRTPAGAGGSGSTAPGEVQYRSSEP